MLHIVVISKRDMMHMVLSRRCLHPNTRLYVRIHGEFMSLVAVRDNCDRANVSVRLLVHKVYGRGRGLLSDRHINADISSACMYAHVMHTLHS